MPNELSSHFELLVKLFHVLVSVNERFDSVKEFAQAAKTRKSVIIYIIPNTVGNGFVTGPKVPFTALNPAKYLGRQAVCPVCGWTPGRDNGL